MMGLRYVSQRGNQGEFQDGRASVWASLCESQVVTKESFKVVKLMHGLYNGCLGGYLRSCRVVKLVMVLYHQSSRVVKLVIGLYQRYFTREQEVSWGGEATDVTLSKESQSSGVYGGTSPWQS